MATKTISLRDSTTQDVISALFKGMDDISIRFPMLINLHEVSLNGIELSMKEMACILENLRDYVDYGYFSGHTATPYCNVSYDNINWFSYDKFDKELRSSGLTMKLNAFAKFKFYISESNWIDLHFITSVASYVTMCIKPKMHQ